MPNSYARKLTLTWTDGNNPITKQVALGGDSVDGRMADVPTGHTVFIDMAFAKAKLQGFYLLSDEPIELITNHLTGSGDEFLIGADSPFAWYADSGIPCPFTHDVIGLYLQNSHTGPDATVQIEAIYDQ